MAVSLAIEHRDAAALDGKSEQHQSRRVLPMRLTIQK